MTQQYTPTTEQVYGTAAFGAYEAARSVGEELDIDEFKGMWDRWLAEERAKVWLEALQHVQRLSDPAYTVSLPPDREVLTLPDVYQAMAENPYRREQTDEN